MQKAGSWGASGVCEGATRALGTSEDQPAGRKAGQEGKSTEGHQAGRGNKVWAGQGGPGLHHDYLVHLNGDFLLIWSVISPGKFHQFKAS